MVKKTAFDFGGVDNVAAAVDRFAPPDSTGKLKKLRVALLETLADKTNVTAVEAADMIAFKLFAADLTTEEIDYAVTRLFISNPYFSEMVSGIVKSKLAMYPTVSVEGDGQAVFVASETTTEVAPEPVKEVVAEPVVQPIVEEFTVATEVEEEDHTTILTTEDQSYLDIQQSNDDEVAETVVEKVVEDVQDFGAMKVPELREYAAKHNIDLGSRTKKVSIVAAIIEELQRRGEY